MANKTKSQRQKKETGGTEKIGKGARDGDTGKKSVSLNKGGAKKNEKEAARTNAFWFEISLPEICRLDNEIRPKKINRIARVFGRGKVTGANTPE